MNILIISNSLQCYGANNSMLDLLVALYSRGINVIVFLPGYGEIVYELQKKNVEYYVVPYEYSTSLKIETADKVKKILTNISLIGQAKKIIIDKKIDLIHTNASNVDFGAVLALICKVPHIWHIRELLYDDYGLKYDFPTIEKLLLRKATYQVAISKYVFQKRKTGKNCIILYDGINIGKYILFKEELFVDDVIHLLYCGQIIESKGIMDAVNAVELLVQAGQKNVVLDIVGAESEYCKYVIEYVETHSLARYINYYEHREDMSIFREKADIALVCSRSEAFGRVTIESMLGGCLVIGADAGGTSELIRDGVTGYLYKPGDILQLKKRILDAFNEKEKTKQIIKNAKKYASKRFDSNIYAEKIEKMYLQVIRRAGRKYD